MSSPEDRAVPSMELPHATITNGHSLPPLQDVTPSTLGLRVLALGKELVHLPMPSEVPGLAPLTLPCHAGALLMLGVSCAAREPSPSAS